MPSSHYSGLWKNIPRCLPQIQMGLAGHLRLNIDNNPAERLNRGIAIIRKNCLFAGSEAGGQRLAILYSFAATCKANGICFRKWLEDVLLRLTTTPVGEIDSLIPGAKQSSQ